MTDKNNIEYLKLMYHRTQCVCDPLEFAVRQNKLLHAIADYLIVRDSPEEEDKNNKDDEDNPYEN
jgi:hypothetical protein